MWRLVSLIVVCWVGIAVADESDRDRDARLFERGRALAAEGKWADACALFERSYELDPALGTLLNLADCHEQLGQLAQAWRLFSNAKARAKNDGDDERAAFARDRAKAIKPKLVMVIVKVADPTVPGMKMVVGGRQVVVNTAELREVADPGQVELEVMATGKPPYVRREHAQGGETVTFDVPAFAFANHTAESSDGKPPKIWLGLFIGGVTVGLVGAALTYDGSTRVHDARRGLCRGGGYIAAGLPDRVDELDCKNPEQPFLDPDEITSLNNEGFAGRNEYNVGIVSATMGGGLALLSFYMYFIRDTTPSNGKAVAVTPIVTRDGAGATLRIAW